MVQQGEMPDAITCSALISACGKGKQPEQALKVFERMVQQGVVPDAITYSASPRAGLRMAQRRLRERFGRALVPLAGLEGCRLWAPAQPGVYGLGEVDQTQGD